MIHRKDCAQRLECAGLMSYIYKMHSHSQQLTHVSAAFTTSLLSLISLGLLLALLRSRADK
ncbi:hypothetical protein [Casimicrobium huifangae]|uniref:hypothetical protein n=1 Tax=Casimicrobium huifangae TaxID=2591109 RepID=UPI00378488CF